MRKLIPLPAAALRRKCSLNRFDFDTTADLPMLSEVLGQPRAVAALEFVASIASHGFNVIALGQPGSRKTTLIRDYLKGQAAMQPAPPDQYYVHNFGLHHLFSMRLKRYKKALVRGLESGERKRGEDPEI